VESGDGGMAGKSHSANIRRYPKREVWMTKEEYLRQKKYYDIFYDKLPYHNNKIPSVSDGDSIIIIDGKIEKLKESFEGVECSICLEEICRVKSVKLKCGHIYHKKCINKWKFMNDSCCLCKRPIEATKPTFLTLNF